MEKSTKERVFTDANKLINHLTKLAVNKNNVFRGYGKQSEMYPSIIRERDWSSQEIILLSEFEKYGLQYFSANSPVDFLSYAQHYGLPTRLLDYTYNPFTALSFALFMQKSTNYKYPQDREYYYISYCNLEQQIHIRSLPYYYDNQIFRSESFASKCNNMIQGLKRVVNDLKEPYQSESSAEKNIISYFKQIYSNDHPEETKINIPQSRIFIDEIINKFEERKALLLDVNQCNQRIIMQQGLFLFPYTLEPKEHLKIIENNMNVIKIHKDIRGELLEYLDTIGLNSYRLMPDLQSVCYTVKRKVIEEKRVVNYAIKNKANIDIANIHTLLKEGFEKYKLKSGYANVAPVGAYIKRKIPDFNVHEYGFSKLSELIENHPNMYVLERDNSKEVPIVLYKCL